MNIEELFAKGGPVVWVLACYSAVGLAIVLERLFLFMRLRRLPRGLAQKLDRLLDRPDGAATELAAIRGPEARIVQTLVSADRDGVSDLRGLGSRIRAEEMQRMEFGLRTLGVLGNTAPLLGLLGTITGMIKAFMVIEAAGGKVDAQALAGGIWEAMITTGVGLAVAIPLVILLHLLEGIVERRGQSMARCIALLLERRSVGPTDDDAPASTHRWEDITDGV